MSFLDNFPDAWKTSITVKSGGGRDDLGDPIPSETREIQGCLLHPKTTEEQDNQSSYVEGRATVYVPSGSGIRSTDQIITPEGSVLQGTWAVDGDPILWPWAEAIGLRKDGT